MSSSLLENLGSKRGDFLEGAGDSSLLSNIAGGVLFCWYGMAVDGLPNYLTWSLFVPQIQARPSTVLLLESRVIEDFSIQPPTTLIIKRPPGNCRAHHNNLLGRFFKFLRGVGA
jgi:hypothetical protein